MSKTETKAKAAEVEKTRLEILLERKDRHLKNIAKIEAVLARQTAFLAYGTKAKARAKFRELYLRANAPIEVLTPLGFEPATELEKAEIETLLDLFRRYPWAEKAPEVVTDTKTSPPAKLPS